MPDPWESLSRNQKAAVLHEKGPAAVFAGPGSGKTRVVTLRAARLASQGSRLLVTTFTNDATQEMRKRLETLLQSASKNVTVTTLHAFCLQLLRRQNRRFQLLTDPFQQRALAEASKAGELDGGVGGFLQSLSYQKNLGFSSITYAPDSSSEDLLFFRAWREYERRKAEKGLREFDDLVLDAKELLERDENARRETATQYEHIIVDECQDMNAPQYAVVFALGRDTQNLMLVGDLDQSLYGFRGADAQTFRRFAQHAATKVYELRENYRSVRSVIAFSDSLIRQDPDRHPLLFVPTRSEGEPVAWNRYADPDIEALAVAQRILALKSQGAKYSDSAVLYRFNAQSEALERHFTALEIPYILREEGDFYARREVQGLLAYLQFFSTEDDKGEIHADEWLLALLNTPNRKIPRSANEGLRNFADIRGRKIWDVLSEYHAGSLAENRGLRLLKSELERIANELPRIAHAGDAIQIIRRATHFDDWLKKYGGESKDNDRLQNIQRMQAAAAHYATPAEYLAAVQRVRDEAARRKAERARKRREEDAVTLSTGHSSKGLEWRYVFAIGWNEEILPHRKADDLNEERRIAYVIATRARDRLHISSLESWNDATVAPSRFLTQANLALTVSAEEVPSDPLPPEESQELLGGLFLAL